MKDRKSRELQEQTEKPREQLAKLRNRPAARMRRWLAHAGWTRAPSFALIGALVSVPVAAHATPIGDVPNQFTNGMIADADEVNENFAFLVSGISTHEGDPSAHHSKTTDYSELGVITDGYVPNDITIDYATTAGSATTAGHATTAGSATTAGHATTADSAGTLDGLDSLQFLRSDASDSFTTGSLTLASGTTLDVDGSMTVGPASFDTATGPNILTIGGTSLLINLGDLTDPDIVNVQGQILQYGLPLEGTVVSSTGAAGSGNDPSATTQFLSPTVSVAITNPWQRVHFMSNQTFGGTAGAAGLDLYPCYKSSTGSITPLGSGMYNMALPNAGTFRLVFGVSGVTPQLPSDTYQVGMCGDDDGDGGWNNNEWGYVTALVIQE